MRIVVQNTEHGGQRGAATRVEERASTLFEGTRGEVRCFLQHDLAHRGRQTRGTPTDDKEASRGPGRGSQRADWRGGLSMARKKGRGNGDGDVWPRKNKEGKVIGYRASYFGPDGKRRYVSGKTKEEARAK